MKNTYAWLGLILALTALHRGVFAWAILVLTGDAGSVGLMAQNILEGERPLFLYGFPYSGSFVAYVTALVFRIAGDSLVALFAVPILFSVGWAAASFGLFRELLDERAGLAAAVLVAVPDWITTHYSAIPDCSYTPLFLIGTSSLWLAVRIAQRDLSPASRWVHVLGLGALAGLGLWTHFLVGVYLGAGAILLIPYLLRERFAISVLLPFAVGGCLMGLFLLPYLSSPDPTGGSTAGSFALNPEMWELNARILVERILPVNMGWPLPGQAGLRGPAGFMIAGGAALWVLHLVTAGDARDRRNSLVPLLLVAVFLVMYLPHKMAVEAEPRYTIVPWAALVSGLVAVPMASMFRWVRMLSAALLVMWTGYNLAGWGVMCARRASITAEQREAREWLVQQARAAGLSYVEMVGGDYDFAVQAQPLSFRSGNTIRFVAASNERRAASAQASDSGNPRGFACPPGALAAVTGALSSLGADFAIETGQAFALVHSVNYPLRPMRTVPAHEMRVGVQDVGYGAGDGLRDRRRSTYVDGKTGRLLIDLGRERQVAGMAAFPVRMTSDLLTQPSGYLIEGSIDGTTYRDLLRIENTVGLAHPAGPLLYLDGDYGWWQTALEPEAIRFLRITPGEAPSRTWQFAEWLVFETMDGDPPRPVEDVAPVVEMLKRNGIAFTTADRWMSARLLEVGSAGAAYPRYNDHLLIAGGSGQPARLFQPAPDQALVVDRAVADDALRVLHATYGLSFPLRRSDFSAYTLFCFDQTGSPALQWTGYTVIRP